MARTYIAKEQIMRLKARMQQKAREPAPLTVKRLLKSVTREVRGYLKKDGALEAIAEAVATAAAEQPIVLSIEVLERFYVNVSKRGTKSAKSKASSKTQVIVPENAQDKAVLAQVLSQEQFESLKQAILAVTQTHKQGASLKRVVEELFDWIVEDLNQAYDWEDVHHWFEQDGKISCSPNSLRVTFQKVQAERRKAEAAGETALPDAGKKAGVVAPKMPPKMVPGTAQEAEAKPLASGAPSLPSSAPEALPATPETSAPSESASHRVKSPLPPSEEQSAVASNFIGLE